MNPLEWINSKLAEFLEMPARWRAWYSEAQQIFEAEARYRTSQGSYVQSDAELAAIEMMLQLDQMLREHAAVMGKLQLERRETLGAVPVVWIVVGTAVSALLLLWAISGLFKKDSAAADLIRELRSLNLTPEQVMAVLPAALSADEQSALQQITGALGAAAKLLLLVAGVAVLGPFVAERLKGRR